MAKRNSFNGIPGSMQNIMKQAQRMQRQMEEAQKDIESKTFEGTSGGGVVKVTVTGKKQVQSVEIKPEAVDPDDVEMLQDLVMTAVNEALAQVDKYSEEKLGTGGSGINLQGLY